LRKAINDDAYVQGPFISKVAKRGAEIIEVMKKSSAASAANAACDHMHDWWIGTRPGEFVSMGVVTEETNSTYGIANGICYSLPVTCEHGEWKTVNNLKIDTFSQEKIKATEKELLEERKMALNI